MGPIFASAVIDAPREQVFALLSDMALRPGFMDHFQTDYRLERLDSSGVGAAARFRIDAPRTGGWAETVIEAIEAPHLIRERGQAGRWSRIPTRTVWELLEGPGSAVTVKVAFWTRPGHPLDAVKERLGAARWHRRQLQRALQRLCDVAESDRPQGVRMATAGG
jgi:uncharacterized protein YndB with AHSA1/START domain